MKHRRKIGANPIPLTGNLITNPYALENASWNLGAHVTVTANLGMAPDGTMAADLCVPDAVSTSAHNVRQGGMTTAGAIPYLFRGRLKPAGYRSVEMLIGSSTGYANFLGFTFDFASGVVGVKRNSTYDGYARMTPLNNGWYLCDTYLFNTVSNNTHTCELHISNSADPIANYAGDAAAGIYGWGIEFAPIPN